MMDVGRDIERIRDYIGGRLPDDERRTFEDRLAADPGLVRELEQSVQLREGFELLQAQGYFAPSILRAKAFRRWGPILVAAAIAGFAAVALWLRPQTQPAPVLLASLGSRSMPTDARPVAAHFTFLSMRGGSTPDLDLPRSGLIELRAAPPARVTGSVYRVTLVEQDAPGSWKPIGVVGDLALGGDGYVHSYADASRLPPGLYQLRIDSGAGTAPETYSFKLRAAIAP
jgi:hypothetical protein